MPVIVVANPKGGVGKSTVSTNLAGALAHRGRKVMLGDIDRQQSTRLWLNMRPPSAPAIQGWDIGQDEVARPPKGVTHVVLDTPAGLHGKDLVDVMRHADMVLVPLQPSLFDIQATHAFVQELATLKRASHVRIGLVGMRVREVTLAADQLKAFLGNLGLPVLGMLRDTQNYVQLAARGLTLWDAAPSKVERDLPQWNGVLQWAGA
jgi:chromosome partitioning protein